MNNTRMNKPFKTRTFAQTLELICRASYPQYVRDNGTINQTAFARRLGVNQPQILRWLSGTVPDQKSVDHLAKVLRLSQAQVRGEAPIVLIDDITPNALGEQTALYELPPPINHNRVPMISSVQAGDWKEAHDPHPAHTGTPTAFQSTTATPSAPCRITALITPSKFSTIPKPSSISPTAGESLNNYKNNSSRYCF